MAEASQSAESLAERAVHSEAAVVACPAYVRPVQPAQGILGTAGCHQPCVLPLLATGQLRQVKVTAGCPTHGCWLGAVCCHATPRQQGLSSRGAGCSHMLPATVDGAGTHPPGPANRDRPTVLSRQRRKLSKVGAMSPVVRQELPTCSVTASICTQPALKQLPRPLQRMHF